MYEGMIAETVGIRGHNDDLIEGYLARPLGAGTFPGGCCDTSPAGLG